jgi:hypothetical protein
MFLEQQTRETRPRVRKSSWLGSTDSSTEEHDEEIREWTRRQSKQAHEEFESRKKTHKKDGVTEFGELLSFSSDFLAYTLLDLP